MTWLLIVFFYQVVKEEVVESCIIDDPDMEIQVIKLFPRCPCVAPPPWNLKKNKHKQIFLINLWKLSKWHKYILEKISSRNIVDISIPDDPVKPPRQLQHHQRQHHKQFATGSNMKREMSLWTFNHSVFVFVFVSVFVFVFVLYLG